MKEIITNSLYTIDFYGETFPEAGLFIKIEVRYASVHNHIYSKKTLCFVS